jgi:L-ascorbate metabolism protein UlaG (beta-lactamase superfamily)
MTLLPAIKKDRALLDEIEAFSGDKAHVYVWWLGQSGFLVAWNGYRLLLDPYLSDSLTRKYAGTQKPHIRMSERVIDPALLRNISLLTSSHNHTDHLDAETLCPLLENNPATTLVIPEANRRFVAERLGCAIGFPAGLDEGRELTVGPFHIHGIAAAHNDLAVDEQGRHVYLGYVIKMGSFTVYHSGDCLLYEGLIEKLRAFSIDLAILPINGNDPSRGVAGNFNGSEAATLAKEINARCVIPCHYHMFAFNSVEPDEFITSCQLLQQSFAVLQQGGCWSHAL